MQCMRNLLLLSSLFIFCTPDPDFITLKWTKVTISGPPGSGKSSTLKLLLNEDPDPLHNSTPVMRTLLAKESKGNEWDKVPSIDDVITPILYPNEDDTDFEEVSNYHFIYAIDTGGQAAFYDIAPAIIRYDSVNLITHKLNEGLEDETSFYYSIEGKHIGRPIKRNLTNEQVLELSIRSFTSVDMQDLDLESVPSQSRRYGDKMNILVLGTFRDEVQEEEITEKKKCLQEKLKRFEHDAGFLKQEGQPLFIINAISRSSDEKQKAALIRRKVCNSYIEATIPIAWFVFIRSLQDLNQSIVDIQVCREKGLEYEMAYDEVEKALHFYHNLTVVLYFNEIPSIVFLEPQVLFDELTELISISFADHVNHIESVLKIDLPPNAHDDLKEKGLFKETLLEAIGTKFQVDNFLKLLESLNIIVKVPLNEGQSLSSATRHQYFLPCVLATTKREDLQKEFRKNIDPLLLKWDGKMIPQGLFCALVLNLLKEDNFDAKKFCSQPHCRYRNIIHLPCKNNLDGMVLLVDSVNYLEIYYSGNHSNCYKIREAILKQLGMAVRKYQYNPRLSKPEKAFYRRCCHCNPQCEGDTCKNECVCTVNKDNKGIQCPLLSERAYTVDTLKQSPWLSKYM